MNAMFAIVILGVVAAASAATVPAGTSVYQQYQQPAVQYQPYQAVVQSQPQQVVAGRVVPAVYSSTVGSQVYPAGVVHSTVYNSGIVRNVHPASVVPAVAGAHQYYPNV